MRKQTQHGFGHLAVVLLLLVVTVIGFAGYKVAKNHNSTVSSSATPAAVEQVQTIKTKSDLNTVQSTLDSAAVDSDLNPDTLNDDLNSLL